MEIGELFRVKEGSKEQKEMILRVEAAIGYLCGNCVGKDNPLCGKLPTCMNANNKHFKFIELTPTQAKLAIKQKLTINQY